MKKSNNKSKTTRRCTKCFTFKANNQFEMLETGRYKSWCMECVEAYHGKLCKVPSGSSHYSMFRGMRAEDDAVISKTWFSQRISELTELEKSNHCHVTKATRELNQTIYKYLFC